MHDHHHEPPAKFRWVFWGFAAVAAFFLLAEHTAHVLGALPYLLLLACPLMHLFMHHGGHAHHHHHDSPDDKEDDHDQGRQP
ncbi:DUF2933 domain-containing protein [Chromobacterium violaceum]|uniref:DUF2933 domain-containing protein n=2 Tax=Chromobacterium violaceum TaxID=536 RepID=Q7NT47_CHRVO|nr:DUF2933 domain-containing protein [Chromobacterium violaceum]AAQ60881.1 conserved hypothetical protein [Chromobacterium violaceum ATCC 12472]KMN47276.1 hypothetical protein VK93_21425 [Chromobacterium violaceum]KMN85996.1 hypothetical protein VL02_11600 [Chromobacterium violaceum]KMN88379.1 hypothetical protein VL04_21035 [Chromobacterium violaceum]KMO02834.1 hypothetical protein VL16_16460 [Chromobacterium violaceum]